jgi:hypothetical protein
MHSLTHKIIAGTDAGPGRALSSGFILYPRAACKPAKGWGAHALVMASWRLCEPLPAHDNDSAYTVLECCTYGKDLVGHDTLLWYCTVNAEEVKLVPILMSNRQDNLIFPRDTLKTFFHLVQL